MLDISPYKKKLNLKIVLVIVILPAISKAIKLITFTLLKKLLNSQFFKDILLK